MGMGSEAVDGWGWGDVGVGILQLEINTFGVISIYNRISPHVSEFESFYNVR